MREARIGAAEMFWNFVPKLAEAFDVNFVDDRFVELPARRSVVAPVEAVINDHGLRDIGCAIALVALQVVATKRIRKHRVVPRDVAADRLRVRIDQQLCRIAPQPLYRVPSPVDAETVALTWSDTRKIPVPAERGTFRQTNTPLLTGAIEQAEIDRLCDLGKDREVGSTSVPRCAERKRFAWPNGNGRRACAERR